MCKILIIRNKQSLAKYISEATILVVFLNEMTRTNIVICELWVLMYYKTQSSLGRLLKYHKLKLNLK